MEKQTRDEAFKVIHNIVEIPKEETNKMLHIADLMEKQGFLLDFRYYNHDNEPMGIFGTKNRLVVFIEDKNNTGYNFALYGRGENFVDTADKLVDELIKYNNKHTARDYAVMCLRDLEWEAESNMYDYKKAHKDKMKNGVIVEDIDEYRKSISVEYMLDGKKEVFYDVLHPLRKETDEEILNKVEVATEKSIQRVTVALNKVKEILATKEIGASLKPKVIKNEKSMDGFSNCM